MDDKTLVPIELTDAELDAVSGGQIGNSLIAIQNVLNHDQFLNNNHVSVAVGVLSSLVTARSS